MNPSFIDNLRDKLRAAASTIQVKLSAVILALVLAVVALLAGVFTARLVHDLEARLVRKAELYGQLMAGEVSSAVAFDDRQTAREAFASLAVDEDVVGAALYGANGRLLEARGELETPTATLAPVAAASLTRGASTIRTLTPVVSVEGPRGTLLLELTTAPVRAEARRAVAVALGWGAAAAVLGLLAAWFIARSLARRLSALSRAAGAVAGGNLDQEPVLDRSRDEIGALTAAFNAMWAKLRALLEQIQRSAREEAERLDGLVKARTAELDRRNAEMRLVLDHVDQGLVTVDPQGRLGEERSRVVDAWFGAPPSGVNLWDWLLPEDEARRQWFAMAWAAVEEGALPLDVTIDQLPTRLERGGSTFELTYKPLAATEQGGFSRMLVVITDLTARRERERAERERKELGEVIERFHRDREGVRQTFTEARRLVEVATTSEDPVVIARALHTLKGNAAMVGLGGLAQLCHELETALTEDPTFPAEQRAQLSQTWADTEQRFAMVLDAGGGGRFEVAERDYEAVLQALDRGAPAPQLRRLLQRIRHEPVERHFGRLAEQATRLAERLDKGPLQVDIEGNDVRLPPQALGDFWAALVHVVRNAVDHGLEDPGSREGRGGDARARMAFSARVDTEGLELEIRDFGRGIDWQKVKDRAEARGFPCSTPQDLMSALFADGVSTKDEVTDLSGRGVGMGAARQACEDAGGAVRVESAPGAGTAVSFRFPAAAVGVLPASPRPRAEGERPSSSLSSQR